MLECHESQEACSLCQAAHPIPPETRARGMKVWQAGPMPEYCAVRLQTLARQEQSGECSGICGKFEKLSEWGTKGA